MKRPHAQLLLTALTLNLLGTGAQAASLRNHLSNLRDFFGGKARVESTVAEPRAEAPENDIPGVRRRLGNTASDAVLHQDLARLVEKRMTEASLTPEPFKKLPTLSIPINLTSLATLRRLDAIVKADHRGDGVGGFDQTKYVNGKDAEFAKIAAVMGHDGEIPAGYSMVIQAVGNRIEMYPILTAKFHTTYPQKLSGAEFASLNPKAGIMAQLLESAARQGDESLAEGLASAGLDIGLNPNQVWMVRSGDLGINVFDVLAIEPHWGGSQEKNTAGDAYIAIESRADGTFNRGADGLLKVYIVNQDRTNVMVGSDSRAVGAPAGYIPDRN